MNKKITILVFVLFSSVVFSQEDSTKKFDINEEIKKLPAFTMFGDNYFITGTSIDKDISSETSDAKFQLGFKQRLTNVRLPWNTFAFFTYRQKSFWDIYKESFPFRETNYNPALGFAKVFFNETGMTDGLWLSFEHESNGRSGENSRSWNFISLQYVKFYKENWQFRIKAWGPIGDLTDNSDILDYRGVFEVGTTWNPLKNLFLDADFRQAFSDGLRGSIKLGASYKISKNSNQYIYLQYYGGYSEDLIDYNRHVSNLRIGIAFKNLFGNFANY